jgi:peptidoglycan/xylan/chitin deacetylase (PgdA/CDA1 family)
MGRITEFFFTILMIFYLPSCYSDRPEKDRVIVDDHGAVIRKDTTSPVIHLVFTGHDFAEGYPVIRETLVRHDILASFFFTGNFYRTAEFKSMIETLIKDGHYLGAHSDRHLLYCSWEDRDSLLVDRKTFTADLEQNYREMERFGIEKEEARWFMPPYEWYNKTIARWTASLGLILVNFSPGTRSNADYTWPELGGSYVSSDEITDSILEYEKKSGMNGFILLIHLGTDPRRKDKYYNNLDNLIGHLKYRGYGFKRIDD